MGVVKEGTKTLWRKALGKQGPTVWNILDLIILALDFRSGVAFPRQVKKVAERWPPSRSGAPMPSCEGCGGHITPDFARVFGDNQNRVRGCLECGGSLLEAQYRAGGAERG